MSGGNCAMWSGVLSLGGRKVMWHECHVSIQVENWVGTHVLGANSDAT
jgi:hypothetical protein